MHSLQPQQRPNHVCTCCAATTNNAFLKVLVHPALWWLSKHCLSCFGGHGHMNEGCQKKCHHTCWLPVHLLARNLEELAIHPRRLLCLSGRSNCPVLQQPCLQAATLFWPMLAKVNLAQCLAFVSSVAEQSSSATSSPCAARVNAFVMGHSQTGSKLPGYSDLVTAGVKRSTTGRSVDVQVAKSSATPASLLML
jgi:hypothetical protein